MQDRSILIYGYGNPGRQDDGLGNAFVELVDGFIREHRLSGIKTDSNYQLNIEDAEVIANSKVVLFVDASVEDLEDFIISRVEPSDAHVEFTMHAVSPAFVLDLCRKMFGAAPEAFLMHIKGYEFEFAEGLTSKASENLIAAFNSIKEKLQAPAAFYEHLISITCKS